MKTYNLKSTPYANCKVEIYELNGVTNVILRSYGTRVLALELYPDYNGHSAWIEVHSNGTWSATTARHINRFTTEFLGENYYHKIKSALGFWTYDHYSTYVLCAVIQDIQVISNFCKTLNGYLNG